MRLFQSEQVLVSSKLLYDELERISHSIHYPLQFKKFPLDSDGPVFTDQFIRLAQSYS